MAESTVRRIEVGTRRTRRSTLKRLVDVLLAEHPEDRRARSVVRLADLARTGIAAESPHADRIQRRRERRVL